MKPIGTFKVVPALPPTLERLRDLALNLRWAWNHDTIELFRRLDSDLWETSGHNPMWMLGAIDQAQLEAAAADEGFLAHLDRVAREFDAYLAADNTWFHRQHGGSGGPLVAYFSAEFGLTECLSIFAGGLGILAGDHLKSASDLGVPLVGVGLLYQRGYFRQYLNEVGWQQEADVDNDFHTLPLTLLRQPDGTPLTISVDYPGRVVAAQVWRADAGRVALYLLDTNIPANSPADRHLTFQLYGGDQDTRIQQEILLGIGGYRALEALGLDPTVYHMNEGHAAFLALERVRRLMEHYGLSFAEAREAASAGLIFTTHTPVEAGHDRFPAELMDHYFTAYTRSLGLSRHDFLALGRQNPYNDYEPFCMTILALRLADHSNGVSRLHGEVSRHMWQGLWPGVPKAEIPIGHVTNGVHFQSWISQEMNHLYDRYLGPRWREEPADQSIWLRAARIPGEELWRTHERRRDRLVAFARRRLREQLAQRGASQSEIDIAEDVLDPNALTLGFARRFAPYKRATLLLRDPARLARILNHPERPVQVIFAGKAHPRDEGGKRLCQEIVQLARRPEFRRRIVFLEDYDLAVARYLVQGADVWLNNPRRPQEASGTSGMKAAANGVLNLSTLDGWWDEAYRPEVGWAIGRREVSDDVAGQDQAEAEALYELLERDVVPAFYERGADRLPRRWISHMKASLSSLCHLFNTHRMVQEYTERFYLPAAARYTCLAQPGMSEARRLAGWKAQVAGGWGAVAVESVTVGPGREYQVGSETRAAARIRLGVLTPADVTVEFCVGRVNAYGEFVDVEATPLQPQETDGGGVYLYDGTAVRCRTSGLYGYTVRVLPHHDGLTTPFVPGCIAWAKG
ncbi:MAG: alpha-glucan family phosphorylase [Anaerolineae bacterium]|nr:alpha-glucan family phosphorylase [Anaerolineae bacterium]